MVFGLWEHGPRTGDMNKVRRTGGRQRSSPLALIILSAISLFALLFGGCSFFREKNSPNENSQASLQTAAEDNLSIVKNESGNYYKKIIERPDGKIIEINARVESDGAEKIAL